MAAKALAEMARNLHLEDWLGVSRRRASHNWVRPVALSLMSLVLGACARDDRGGASVRGSDSAPILPQADEWLGRWTGPEGTYLDIGGGGGRYELTIADLDGPRRFEGAAEGASIVFERAGVRETLRSTDGAGTGMKWLAEKLNCLVVAAGEGFCRP
jgi:hypothetical protein